MNISVNHFRSKAIHTKFNDQMELGNMLGTDYSEAVQYGFHSEIRDYR